MMFVVLALCVFQRKLVSARLSNILSHVMKHNRVRCRSHVARGIMAKRRELGIRRHESTTATQVNQGREIFTGFPL